MLSVNESVFCSLANFMDEVKILFIMLRPASSQQPVCSQFSAVRQNESVLDLCNNCQAPHFIDKGGHQVGSMARQQWSDQRPSVASQPASFSSLLLLHNVSWKQHFGYLYWLVQSESWMEFSEPLSFIRENSNHNLKFVRKSVHRSACKYFKIVSWDEERWLYWEVDNVNLSTLVLIRSLHCCLILSSSVLRCFKGKVLTGRGEVGGRGVKRLREGGGFVCNLEHYLEQNWQNYKPRNVAQNIYTKH